MKKKSSFKKSTYEMDFIGIKVISALKANFIEAYNDALIPFY